MIVLDRIDCPEQRNACIYPYTDFLAETRESPKSVTTSPNILSILSMVNRSRPLLLGRIGALLACPAGRRICSSPAGYGDPIYASGATLDGCFSSSILWIMDFFGKYPSPGCVSRLEVFRNKNSLLFTEKQGVKVEELALVKIEEPLVKIEEPVLSAGGGGGRSVHWSVGKLGGSESGLRWSGQDREEIVCHFRTMQLTQPYEERILPYIGSTDRKSLDEDITWMMGNSGQGWKLDPLPRSPGRPRGQCSPPSPPPRTSHCLWRRSRPPAPPPGPRPLLLRLELLTASGGIYLK